MNATDTDHIFWLVFFLSIKMHYCNSWYSLYCYGLLKYIAEQYTAKFWMLYKSVKECVWVCVCVSTYTGCLIRKQYSHLWRDEIAIVDIASENIELFNIFNCSDRQWYEDKFQMNNIFWRIPLLKIIYCSSLLWLWSNTISTCGRMCTHIT